MEFAAKSRLPAVYLDRAFVDVGELISYGVSVPDLWGRAAVLCGQDPQRSETRRTPGREADQIRAGDQPKSSQADRLADSSESFGESRQGD